MPELPEVETIRLGLQKYLVGHKIVGVDVKLTAVGPQLTVSLQFQLLEFGKSYWLWSHISIVPFLGFMLEVLYLIYSSSASAKKPCPKV